MTDKYTLAFPAATENGINSGVSGMSLRDYFAAKAMQALSGKFVENGWSTIGIAEEAYLFADAMMEARKE